MFTVTNREVFPRNIAAVFTCFALITLPLHAGSGTSDRKLRKDAASDSMEYESYEKFMPSHHMSGDADANGLGIKTHRPNRCSDNFSHRDHSRNTRIKIVSYTVCKGDTLLKISKKFKVQISSITAINSIKNANSIRKGMLLKIPIATSSKTMVKEKHLPVAGHPPFRWPVRKVIRYKQDGLDGVKPIGIIITGTPGAKVFSSAPGVVKKIGRMRGFGQYIVISHSGRFSTVYSNLDIIDVAEGDTISSGNAIGRIGTNDRILHFQIDLEGKPKNPLNYLPKNNNFF